MNKSSLSVNGNWGQWSAWTKCDTSCGPGGKYRFRYSNRPIPFPNCNKCFGQGLSTNHYHNHYNDKKMKTKTQAQKQNCNNQHCPGLNLIYIYIYIYIYI